MIIELASAAEVAEAIKSSDAIVIDFAKRNGCVPCKRLEPHFKNVSNKVPGVAFAVVHLDELSPESFVSLMDNYALRATPTVYLFSEGERRELSGRTGPVLIKEIEGLINE